MNYRIAVPWLVRLSMALWLGVGWSAFAMPPITKKPIIDSPPILAWPTDSGLVEPNLNDNASDTMYDLHGQIDSCELMLSTEGNYHPALHDIWPVFLAKFKDRPLLNWMYTTSPPVMIPQLANRQLQIGNIYSGCRPSVAVASMRVIEKLVAAGLTDGQPLPLYTDRGSVILVKHGNPKHIRTVWDLGRADVHIVTPNPDREKGAFSNYAETIYNIARKDTHSPAGMTADSLFNNLFNSGNNGKWLAGERIHHRDLPWSIAYGRGDATVIFSHLARYTKAAFPNLFDIVPLGGTVEDPQPLPGSKIGTRYVVRIKGEWTPRQREAQEKLIETLMSKEFSEVLTRRGLKRPDVNGGPGALTSVKNPSKEAKSLP